MVQKVSNIVRRERIKDPNVLTRRNPQRLILKNKSYRMRTGLNFPQSKNMCKVIFREQLSIE